MQRLKLPFTIVFLCLLIGAYIIPQIFAQENHENRVPSEYYLLYEQCFKYCDTSISMYEVFYDSAANEIDGDDVVFSTSTEYFYSSWFGDELFKFRYQHLNLEIREMFARDADQVKKIVSSYKPKSILHFLEKYSTDNKTQLDITVNKASKNKLVTAVFSEPERSPSSNDIVILAELKETSAIPGFGCGVNIFFRFADGKLITAYTSPYM